MPIYSKAATADQRKWLADYEAATGFEALHQEDLDSGALSFQEVARRNIRWFEGHCIDALHGIPQIPEDPDPTGTESSGG